MVERWHFEGISAERGWFTLGRDKGAGLQWQRNYKRDGANTQMNKNTGLSANQLDGDLYYRVRQLYAQSWLPHAVLGAFCLCLLVVLYPILTQAQLAVMLLGLFGLAMVRRLAVRRFRDAGLTKEQALRWYGLSVGGALLTGVLCAAILGAGLLQGGASEQLVLLAVLAALAPVLCLASSGCPVSFLGYTLPVAGIVLQVFFVMSGNEPGQGLALLFLAVLGGHLLFVRRVGHIQLQRVRLQDRLAQAEQNQLEQEQELARQTTLGKGLELQVANLQAHLEDSRQAHQHASLKTLAELRLSGERLQLALNASGLALWDWDLMTQRVYHEGADWLLGIENGRQNELLVDLRPLVHPDDQARVQNALTDNLKGVVSQYALDYRMRHADGHWVWVEDRGRVIARDAEGRALRMIGTRRNAGAARQQAQERYLASLVFEASSEAIMLLDSGLQNILAVNGAFDRMTGQGRDPAQLTLALLPLLRSSWLDERLSCIDRSLEHCGCWQEEVEIPCHDGSRLPVLLRLRRVRDEQEGYAHVMASFTDVSQLAKTRQQLDHLMRHDGLTGLMNRNLFRQTVQAVVASGEQQVVLMCLDLDRFKVLNDSLGSSVGDEILRQVSARLQQLAGDARAMARSAGDEFMLLWTDKTSLEQAQERAGRLLQGLRQPFQVEGQELLLSLSLGIALLEPGCNDADTLLSQAGQAWRHAKYLGGDRYQLYHGELPAMAAERLALEQQLRRGLKEGHFQAFYQPKVGLADGLPYAVEALARWHHPERGLISPAVFIPLAEEVGLIGELSEQIFLQACRQAVSWQQQGMQVQVSVNLSAQHLREGNVLGVVRRVLEETGLPATLLELELTESQLPDNLEQLEHILNVFHYMGVQVAIDDFGTGYSSLSYLTRLQVSGVKIDQSFIREMTGGSRDVAIVQAIISLAHKLELRVVAEGVETLEQLQLLESMGCDAIQGYYMARPMPADEVSRFLADRLTDAQDCQSHA